MTDEEFLEKVEEKLGRRLTEDEKIYALNQLPRYSGLYPIKVMDFSNPILFDEDDGVLYVINGDGAKASGENNA